MKYQKQQVGVMAAIIKNGKFLFVRRHHKSKYEAGKWGFVGGGVEFGENPLDTLKREVKEEVGLEIYDTNLFNIYSNVFERDDEIKHVILILFVCRANSKKVKCGSDISEYKWLKLEDAKKLDLIKGNEIIINDLIKTVCFKI